MKHTIGIFGGTFDPPHLGHLILASEAKQQLGLDKVLWVVTPDSPFKTSQNKSDIEHRVVMVKLAIEPEPAFELSLVELQRPGPHYTIDTLTIIQNEYPQASLVLLMGGDSLSQLHEWKDPQGILQIVHKIGVMARPSESRILGPSTSQLAGLEQKLAWVSAPLLEISSSDIRARIASGRHYRFFLPNAVFEYMQNISVYQPR